MGEQFLNMDALGLNVGRMGILENYMETQFFEIIKNQQSIIH